jgi:hypothetical protein
LESGVLFKVMVPHASVSIERSKDDPSSLLIVPAPADGDVAEVFLVFTQSDAEPTLPESAEGRPKGHLGVLQLQTGASVSVDFRYQVFLPPPRTGGSLEMISGDREDLLKPGSRAVFSMETPDGPAFVEGVFGVGDDG